MTVDAATGTAPTEATPRWLIQGDLALCPCGCIGKRKKGSFVEKTLDSASNLMRQAMFGEDVANQSGLLQRLDPRVKILSMLALLIATAFLRHIPALLGMYAITLILAVSSGLPLGFFIKRVWLFIPIFTGIIVIPAMFSFVTPGNVILPLWTWHGHPVGITEQGLRGAALIVTRVATSISLVVLLTLTTPWVKLLAALRALAVPRIFVLIIGMAYRYIFLLLGTVTDMYEARKARTVGAQSHDRGAREFLGASAGTLFGKAHHLSEEVHQAMVARGYRGNARTVRAFRLTGLDVAAVLVVLAATVAILTGDHLLGR